MENEQGVKKKSWLKVPHTYTIIFAIIFLAGIASYIIPAGEFERVEDEEGRNEHVGGPTLPDAPPESRLGNVWTRRRERAAPFGRGCVHTSPRYVP